MPGLRLPHFRFDPSKPVHDPLVGDKADPTDAAVSLQSGTFQYVNSSLLRSTSSSLTHVSASAIDPSTGDSYFLRRASPNIVILDASGNTKAKVPDPALVCGHSIKIIQAGSGNGPQAWVTDKGSCTIRLYGPDGSIGATLGPAVPGGSYVPGGSSITFGKITDIAYDAIVGQYYITDGDTGGDNHRVIVLDPSLCCTAVWSSAPWPSTVNPIQFGLPHAVAVDPWCRVWIVDSQNSNVQVVAHTGQLLNTWTFPGVTLYGISISTARAANKNTAMVHLTGNTSGSTNTGIIILLSTAYNSQNPSDIGSNTPLTTWKNQPDMLHWICSGSIAQQDTILLSNLATDATPGASAYQLAVQRPLFVQPPSTPAGPLWPTSFEAVALMAPFEIVNQQGAFCVAAISYTESASMEFDLYSMTGIHVSYRYQANGPQTTFSLSINGSAYTPPAPTTKIIPAHDWIANPAAPRKTQFQGQSPILGVQTNWWYATKPGEEPNPPPTFWHWFKSDTNVPWRTMNSTMDNPDNVPVLQDFAFINWPTFTASSTRPSKPRGPLGETQTLPEAVLQGSPGADISAATFLSALVQLDKQGVISVPPAIRQANLNMLGQLVPGLSPGSGGLDLPIWPNKFFLTCTMTAINANNPMSTEVLYDYNDNPRQAPASPQLQRTRMFSWDGTSATDAILTLDASTLGHEPGTTYLITRYANGSFTCLPPIRNIGPVPPNWAAQTGAVIVATITNNPQLSPGVTTRIFNCPFYPDPSQGQSQFWVWYSNAGGDDTPVVFGQTLPPPSVGTNLALADYNVMQTTPLIDLVSFTVPARCKSSGNK